MAEDIANVELRPTFVSLVDDTGSGQDVIDKLDKHKVNIRFIRRVHDGMGTWLAVFNNDGDVCAAISKRPDTTPLTALLKEKGDEIFADCDGIAIEFDLEKETVKQILHYAKSTAKGLRRGLQHEHCDGTPQPPARGRLFCLQPAGGGDAFLRRLRPPDAGRDARHAGRQRAQRQHSCMVVTMGEQGAVYARTDGESGMVPAKKVDVIDTTGAGMLSSPGRSSA